MGGASNTTPEAGTPVSTTKIADDEKAPEKPGHYELDLTHEHLNTLADVHLPASLTSLDLTGNRLRELEPKLLEITGLQILSLRQNLLTNAAQIAELSSAPVLRQLVLHDNQLKELPSLREFTALQNLDFSWNECTTLQPLSELDSMQLEQLYMVSNKIGAIEGLSRLTSLRLLELGANRIRRIENLDALANLQELWLGRNRIAQITNLSALTALKRISLQSNRLTSMLGLEDCTSLEELYLSHNGISQLEGLASLTRLKVLDVSANRISQLAGLEALSQLEDLWLNDNQVSSLEEVAAALQAQRASLTCLYLTGNPVAFTPGYQPAVLQLLPQLTQLDSNDVHRGK